MLGRGVLVLGLAIGTCLANGQLITGGNGGNSTDLEDEVGRDDALGNRLDMESYGHFQAGWIVSALADSHGIANIAIPGVDGLTSGTDSAQVITSLSDGDAAAVYTANLETFSTLESGVQDPGPWLSVYGRTSSQGTTSLIFNVTAACLMNISGLATASGPNIYSTVQFYNYTTKSNEFVESSQTNSTFTDVKELLPGQYSILASVYADTSYVYGSGQQLMLGTSATNISLNATFTAEPAPEPASLALFGVAVLGLARIRRGV